MLSSKESGADADSFPDPNLRIFKELEAAGDNVLPFLAISLKLKQKLQQQLESADGAEPHALGPCNTQQTNVQSTRICTHLSDVQPCKPLMPVC